MSLRRVEFFDGFQSETTPSVVTVGNQTFLVDSGVPTGATGLDGDTYLDLNTGTVYEKASGAWTSIGVINISGVSGDFTIAGNLTVNGTSSVVNSTQLDVTDANITLNKGGTANSADLANAGITIEMSDATNVGLFYDALCPSKFRIGNEGAAGCVIDESSLQQVANKSIVTPFRSDVKQDIESNLATYAATASNGQIVFATDTKKLYQVLDGNLTELNDGGESKLEINQVAHGFTIHDQVSLQTDGSFVAATNTLADTLPTHTAIEIIDVDNFVIIADTIAFSEAHGFSVGETYYLNSSGALTTTRPTTSGEYICPAFFPLTVDNLQILNTAPQVLLTENTGVVPQAPYFEGERTSGSIQVLHNNETLITFSETISADGGFSGTADGFGGGYLVPEDGMYSITFNLLLNNNTAWVDDGEYMQLYVDTYDSSNTLIRRRVVDRRYQDSGFAWAGGTVTASLNAGDTVQFRAIQLSDVTSSTYTVVGIYTRGIIAKVGNNTSTLLPSLITTGTMKKQTKFLSSDVTANDSDIFDLRFNNLVVGNTYEIVYNLFFDHSINGAVSVIIRNGATIMGQSRVQGSLPSGQIVSHGAQFSYVVPPFVATDTNMTVEALFIQGGDVIRGNGIITETHATIYEIPMNINEVTEF